MNKKYICLLLFVALLTVFAMGCNDSKAKVEIKTQQDAAKMEGDPVKNLAIKEKEWLVKLDQVSNQINQAYTAWEQGKTTRQDFEAELSKAKKEVNAIKEKYEIHLEANPIPAEREQDAVGLMYGKKLRTTLNNFIFIAIDGIKDSKSDQIKKVTDEQLKGTHQTMMVDRYQKYRDKLETAIEQILK